jgi:hypothetical protein
MNICMPLQTNHYIMSHRIINHYEQKKSCNGMKIYVKKGLLPLVNLHPCRIWHVLFIFVLFIVISNLSFHIGRSLEFFGSCFRPCIDCILLYPLVETLVSKIYTLTSCAPLSNTVIALNTIVILLLFPFNRMPSNEICTSTISPTHMALGLISWCLYNKFQLSLLNLVTC